MIAEGRSITLYEEVHSKKKENNNQVHDQFLRKLRSMLHELCSPYVRGTVYYDDKTGFKSIKALFNLARSTPKCLGNLKLSKNKPLETNLYAYKHKLVGRHKLTRAGKIDKHKDSINSGRQEED